MKACINAPDCEGELGDRSQHEECINCRRRRGNWKTRKPEDVRARHRQLTLWDQTVVSCLPKGDRPKLYIASTNNAARRRA